MCKKRKVYYKWTIKKNPKKRVNPCVYPKNKIKNKEERKSKTHVYIYDLNKV